MLQPKPTSPDERRLTRIFRRLDAADRRTLLAFAEFLAQSEPDGGHPVHRPAPPARPEPIPRPEQETVIAAIRRLSSSYAMLERGDMLDETSTLMSSHVLQGRAAAAVIDDLEALFERHYLRYRQRIEGAAGGVADDTESNR